MTGSWRAILLTAVVVLAGCTNGRSTAAAELLRFERAVEQHVSEHGRYPETVDALLPADSLNLPYRAESGVTLRILPREDGFHATARYRNWTCSMTVAASGRTAPDCYPDR